MKNPLTINMEKTFRLESILYHYTDLSNNYKVSILDIKATRNKSLQWSIVKKVTRITILLLLDSIIHCQMN